MTTWLPRGLVFAAGMVLLRLVQGTLINTYPTNAGTHQPAAGGAVRHRRLGLGSLDGMRRCPRQPRPGPPPRPGDALAAGRPGRRCGQRRGGVAHLAVLPRASTPRAWSRRSPPSRRSPLCWCSCRPCFAVALGRGLVDRKRPAEPRRRVTDGSETDVFDAVRDDDRTGPIPPIPAGTGARRWTTRRSRPRRWPRRARSARGRDRADRRADRGRDRTDRKAETIEAPALKQDLSGHSVAR